jgi:hypothetical protein
MQKNVALANGENINSAKEQHKKNKKENSQSLLNISQTILNAHAFQLKPVSTNKTSSILLFWAFCLIKIL